MYSVRRCTYCSKQFDETKNEQWWHLGNYFGISGFFCPDCYDLVSHDSYGDPNNVDGFNMVKKALDKK